jgi:hypothetical protein
MALPLLARQRAAACRTARRHRPRSSRGGGRRGIAGSAAASALADWLPAGMALAPAALPVAVAQHVPFASHRERSAVWRDALDAELLDAVTACATQASLLEEQVNVLESTFQRTRWLPVEQLARPRTAIEATVAHLRREVLRLSDADGLVGCEWWVQRVRPDAGLTFHFDKDECAAADEHSSELIYPALSSVFYLSRAGGATLVLPQRVAPDEEAPRGVIMVTDAPGELDFVMPSPNMFLAFQGDLLHGVLPVSGTAAAPTAEASVDSAIGSDPLAVQQNGEEEEEGEEKDELRLTLLINWWTVVPRAPCCSELPEDMLEALQHGRTSSAGAPGSGVATSTRTPVQSPLGEVDCREADCEEVDVHAPPHLGLGSALQTIRVPTGLAAGGYTARNCDS